jgi:hypothetical protein
MKAKDGAKKPIVSERVLKISRFGAGVLLFLVAAVIIGANEFQNARTVKLIRECATSVASIPNTPVNAANESRLVHTTGEAALGKTMIDEELGLSFEALRVRRKVEMYQWKEEEKTRTAETTVERTEKTEAVGKGKKKKEEPTVETTTSTKKEHYTIYPKTWSEEAIDSSRFKDAEHHENPAMELKSGVLTAQQARLGNFSVNERLLEKLDRFEKWAPTAAGAAKVSEKLGRKVIATEDGLYFGKNPAAPEIGDVRLGFSIISPQTLSVIGQQSGNELIPFDSEAGISLALASTGKQTAGEMLRREARLARAMTFAVRFCGYRVVLCAAALAWKQLGQLVKHLPLLAALVQSPVIRCSAMALLLTVELIGLFQMTSAPLKALLLMVLPPVLLASPANVMRRVRERAVKLAAMRN